MFLKGLSVISVLGVLFCIGKEDSSGPDLRTVTGTLHHLKKGQDYSQNTYVHLSENCLQFKTKRSFLLRNAKNQPPDAKPKQCFFCFPAQKRLERKRRVEFAQWTSL